MDQCDAGLRAGAVPRVLGGSLEALCSSSKHQPTTEKHTEISKHSSRQSTPSRGRCIWPPCVNYVCWYTHITLLAWLSEAEHSAKCAMFLHSVISGHGFRFVCLAFKIKAHKIHVQYSDLLFINNTV